jgi:hypothetical protein
VAHGIFPMMPAQGWPELLLAVEWQKIELTVFNGMPTDAPRCELVCEANGTEQDLQNGIQWPAGYFERHGWPHTTESCSPIAGDSTSTGAMQARRGHLSPTAISPPSGPGTMSNVGPTKPISRSIRKPTSRRMPTG